MKKLLSLALALLMLVGLMPALADSPADPFLVPLELPGLPEGSYFHLGGSRILVQTEGDDPLLIYDLDTDETIVVKPREEDHDLWVDHYVAELAAEGEIFTVAEIEQIRGIPFDELFDYYVKYCDIPAPRSIGTEYVTLHEDYLLNRHTGIITFIPEGLSADRFTVWDTFLSTNEEHTACLQYDINGRLLNTFSFEGSDHQLWGIVPLKDGALAMLYLTENQQTHYQFVLLDRKLNNRQSIDAGSHHNKWLDIYAAHLCEENGRLLLSTHGIAYGANTKKTNENGRITVTRIPNGPYLHGLLVIDTDSGNVHHIEENMLWSITSFLASSDGSYILLPEYPEEDQLSLVNLETLSVTVQMTDSEIQLAFKPYLDSLPSDYLPLMSAPLGYMSWDGGEYAVTPWMIFRVVERP